MFFSLIAKLFAMRGFILLVITGFIFSCGDKKDQKRFSANLTFTVDTVYVDSGNDFIYVKDNLFLSELSPDKSYLINFNRFEGSAERIDLNGLKLDKRIRFEKDGPNGMASFVSSFKITKEEQLLLLTDRSILIFDQDARKIKELALDELAKGDFNGSESYPMVLVEDSATPDRLVGLFVNWKDTYYFILDFDLDKRDFKRIDLPELDKLQEYSTNVLYNGQMMGNFGTSVSATRASDKIVIANNSINGVLVFDLRTDSILVKSWDSPLLGMKRKYLPPKEVAADTGEMEEIMKKNREDIGFGPFNWDEEQKLFFRFSTTEEFGEEKNDNGNYIPTGATVYISIFDENLNLLGESVVPELTMKPKRHFVKDGKIWIFENMEDEVVFVRLGIN